MLLEEVVPAADKPESRDYSTTLLPVGQSLVTWKLFSESRPSAFVQNSGLTSSSDAAWVMQVLPVPDQSGYWAAGLCVNLHIQHGYCANPGIHSISSSSSSSNNIWVLLSCRVPKAISALPQETQLWGGINHEDHFSSHWGGAGWYGNQVASASQ
eukprot:1150511-Pelagomonas_calceolata.AAC.4